MKNLGLVLIFTILFSSKCFSQDNLHGLSAKVAYSTLEKYSFGVGYNFVKFKDDWGWSRLAHNYYLEYVPEHKALGLSANIQYTLIFAKAGMEASFRSKNEMNNSYFSFYPYLGFDLLNGDLSFGPELLTYKSDSKDVGFKIVFKIHPKLIK
ncbi:hypothetical protein [Flavobacterium sp. DG2-3]|uniref:hypothetical protein n=1 Tax=Flavobacterium sp. DG2-3 TaxID=3068317 RepID=UPI00273EFC18|nr:hypothetical protein [Flavobacterium sp. DG2-3]MDP5199809.1 hypothetical protein [Flavobacterium sp. DG2-3]